MSKSEAGASALSAGHSHSKKKVSASFLFSSRLCPSLPFPLESGQHGNDCYWVADRVAYLLSDQLRIVEPFSILPLGVD